MLAAIFDFTLITVVASLCMAIFVIVLTAIRTRQEARHKTRKRRFTDNLLEALGDRDNAAAAIDAIKKQPDLAANCITEIGELIHGSERDRLIDLAEQAGLGDRLRTMLRNGKRRVRLQAAATLEVFQNDQTVHVLRQTLNDRDDDVRLAAGLALSAMNSRTPLSVIVMSQRSRKHETSLMMRRILERVVPRDVQGALAIIRGENSQPIYRATTIEFLARSQEGAKILASELSSLTRDHDSTVRAAAVIAAAEIGARPTFYLAGHALRDPSTEVRLAGLEAIKRLELSEFTAQVAVLTDDPDWQVRFAASELLVAMNEHQSAIERPEDPESAGLAAEMAPS